MIEPSKDEIEAARRAMRVAYDADERWTDQIRAGLTAAARVRAVNVTGTQVEAALRELGITHPSIDDVARVNRALMAANGVGTTARYRSVPRAGFPEYMTAVEKAAGIRKGE